MALSVLKALCLLAVLYAGVGLAADSEECPEETLLTDGMAAVNGPCNEFCSDFKNECPGYRCLCFYNSQQSCILSLKRDSRFSLGICHVKVITDEQSQRDILFKLKELNSEENILWPWTFPTPTPPPEKEEKSQPSNEDGDPAPTPEPGSEVWWEPVPMPEPAPPPEGIWEPVPMPAPQTSWYGPEGESVPVPAPWIDYYYYAPVPGPEIEMGPPSVAPPAGCMENGKGTSCRELPLFDDEKEDEVYLDLESFGEMFARDNV